MNKPVEWFPFEVFWFLNFLVKHFLMMKYANNPVKLDPKNTEAKTTPKNSSVFKMIKFDFLA